MALTDNKVLSWNISLPQILGIIGIFVLCAVAIAFNLLVIGYIVMTLVLCAFFLIVAFDIGSKEAPRQMVSSEAVSGTETEAEPVRTRTKRRTAREI